MYFVSKRKKRNLHGRQQHYLLHKRTKKPPPARTDDSLKASKTLTIKGSLCKVCATRLQVHHVPPEESKVLYSLRTNIISMSKLN